MHFTDLFPGFSVRVGVSSSLSGVHWSIFLMSPKASEIEMHIWPIVSDYCINCWLWIKCIAWQQWFLILINNKFTFVLIFRIFKLETFQPDRFYTTMKILIWRISVKLHASENIRLTFPLWVVWMWMKATLLTYSFILIKNEMKSKEVSGISRMVCRMTDDAVLCGKVLLGKSYHSEWGNVQNTRSVGHTDII